MPSAVMPSLDAALIAFLTGHASLSPLHGGRVGTSLQSALTSLRVASLGGPVPWPWEAQQEWQVEAWGGTHADADLLARTVVAAIGDWRGPIIGGRVVAAYPTLAGLWAPDGARPRYIVQVAAIVMPE